jgi:hypothetical protein
MGITGQCRSETEIHQSTQYGLCPLLSVKHADPHTNEGASRNGHEPSFEPGVRSQSPECLGARLAAERAELNRVLASA